LISLFKKKKTFLLSSFEFRESTDSGWVRVHAGRLQVSESPKLVPVSSGTSAASLLSESLPLFGLESANPDDFSVTEIIMHKGGNFNFHVKEFDFIQY
jgi:hypothetical protein